MKILKFVLIFFAFMILGFLLFMVFSKSEFTATIEGKVNAKRSEVYGLFSDTSHFKEWKSNIVNIEVLKGNPGEKGCEIALTYKPEEQELTITEKLTEVKSREKLIYEVKAPNVFSETRTIKFSDTADWVRVSVTREIKAENWLIKFFLSQLAQALPLETEKELEAIKKHFADRGPSQL